MQKRTRDLILANTFPSECTDRSWNLYLGKVESVPDSHVPLDNRNAQLECRSIKINHLSHDRRSVRGFHADASNMLCVRGRSWGDVPLFDVIIGRLILTLGEVITGGRVIKVLRDVTMRLLRCHWSGIEDLSNLVINGNDTPVSPLDINRGDLGN